MFQFQLWLDFQVQAARQWFATKPRHWFQTGPHKRRNLALLAAALLLLVALPIAFLSYWRNPEHRRDRSMRYAQKSLEAHDLGHAIFYFRTAVKNVPNDPEAHYQLALAYLQVGEVRAAVSELKRTTELDPERTEAQLKLSELYAVSRNHDLMLEGEQRTRAVLAANPQSAEAWNTLAIAEFALGKEEDAVDDLRAAIELAPDFVRPSISLAMLKMKEHDWPEAEKIMLRAAGRAPKSVETAIAVGRFYIAGGKLNQAEVEFRRAAGLDPQSGQALLALGETLLLERNKPEAEKIFAKLSTLPDPKFKPVHAVFLAQEKRYEEAAAELKRLNAQFPGDRVLRTKLIAVYVLSGKIADAEQLLKQVTANNPSDTQALLQSAQLYLRENKPAEAGVNLTAVLQLQPDSAPAHFLMASADRAQHSSENAKRELTEALRVDPKLLAARIQLAQTYIAGKDPRGAIELLDHAPPVQLSNPSLQETRNWALLAAGDLVLAGQAIDKSLEKARTSEFLLQKGILEARRGRVSEARQALEESLQKDPRNVRAIDTLARTYAVDNQAKAGVPKVKEFADRQPSSAAVQYLLGEWQFASANRAEARAAFEKSVSDDPRYGPAQWALARLDLAEGKLDAARQRLKASIDSNGLALEPRLLLALVEDSSGNYIGAIEQYRRALDLEPSNLVVLNNLAYLLADRVNQLEEAQHYAQEAVSLDSGKAALQDTLGWIFYRKGLVQQALPYLQKAVQLEGTPRRKYHLAMAYLKLGKSAEGDRTLKEALQLDPKLPEAVAARQVQAELSSKPDSR